MMHCDALNQIDAIAGGLWKQTPETAKDRKQLNEKAEPWIARGNPPRASVRLAGGPVPGAVEWEMERPITGGRMKNIENC